MKTQFCTFKGINICYTDTGKGTAVVLLHGFLENKTMWIDYAKLLSKTKRVITIDLLGHGNSDCLSYIHTMEEMAEAVKAVLKKCNIRKSYFVGHSMGGYVSLAFAEHFPENIKGICLLHSSARNDSPQKQKDRDRAINIVKKNSTLFINEAIPNLFNTTYKPYKREITKVKKMALQISKQAIVAALEGMKIRPDREIVLKFAPYPVCFIIGKEDNILPHNELIEQAKTAQHGSFVLLENVGHMGFLEEKTQVYKTIKKFVK